MNSGKFITNTQEIEMARFTSASDGQVRFLNTLISERGLTLDSAVSAVFPGSNVETFEITGGWKGTATRLIDAVKVMPKPERPAPEVPGLDLEAGMYKVGMEIFKVKISGQGRPYAQILRHDEDLDQMWFDYEPRLIQRWEITPAHRMTVEQCAEFGVLFGTCCVCARKLTKPESVAKGIGPICESRI